ncbi:MAG: hypothetical protein M2R45_03295 [Verrucomicrobia subdivision 3 bacterium]|nr:hypothetical protein [Limisphaerales bacterium]MCS1415428.1 hypothetical protein [Limisphaerales bacterium]
MVRLWQANVYCFCDGIAWAKKIRATDAKEVGVRNPAEERTVTRIKVCLKYGR